ncbi:MAG: hypothetical protein MZV64_16760 [Ignavibacteriales bacterium]|nr:hypothetical protein [Ignavibacteriales bacterium]
MRAPRLWPPCRPPRPRPPERRRPRAYHVQGPSPDRGDVLPCAGPDAPPFVERGRHGQVGPDACCIIEAMKLMNEIEAERGRRRSSRILAENGQPVAVRGPALHDPAGLSGALRRPSDPRCSRRS